MIPAALAVRVINRFRKDAIVVAASTALREWSAQSRRRELDVDMLDCPDKAVSLGLGLALARPDRKVLVLETDGTLRTNTSGLVTVGAVAPANLVHFLFEDAGFLSTEGTPISGVDGLDFAALTKSAGYPRVYRFEGLEELVISLEEVLAVEGPVFVSLKVMHDAPLPVYPQRGMKDSLRDVTAALADR